MKQVLPRNVRRAPPRPESPSGLRPPGLSGRLINSGQFICYRTGHFYLLLTDITFLSAGVQDIPPGHREPPGALLSDHRV